MKYFNIANEIYDKTSPGSGKRPGDWFKDDLKTYVGRAKRRRGIISYEDMVSRMKKSKKGIFSDEVRKKFGTVYTPDFVVDKTIDLAFKYLPEGSNPLELTWCDPAAGDGNFLINLYYRLMACESEMNPVEKSEHILTHCIHGVEILRNMAYACSVRLATAHLKTIKENVKVEKGYCDILEKMNIHHGNAISAPEDEGKWELEEQEGGMLPDEIRNRKYDVIIGNPPYTRLVNYKKHEKKNIRYADYVDYLDLASIFLKHATNYLSKRGVCSFNISYSIMGKRAKGAVDVRSSIGYKLSELLTSKDIQRYSENDGGNQVTCIMSFVNNKKDDIIIYNGLKLNFQIEDFINGDLQKKLENHNIKYPFKKMSIIDIIPSLSEKRSVNSSKHADRRKYWKESIFNNANSGDYFLIASRRQYLKNDYKLIRTTDIINYILTKYAGWVKYTKIDKQIGMWIIGYMSTSLSSKYLSTYMDARQSGNFEMRTYLWKFLQIPDFDWYKENRSKQFNIYMKWIEDNMEDKDKFLEGIDEQFERLIK